MKGDIVPLILNTLMYDYKYSKKKKKRNDDTSIHSFFCKGILRSYNCSTPEWVMFTEDDYLDPFI